MILLLPNGCTCSELSVFPKDWNTVKPSKAKEILELDWRIQYRFYDPTMRHIPKFKKGKLVIIKGMNRINTLPERRKAVETLIRIEKDSLLNEGYNPITTSSTPIIKKEVAPTPDFSPESGWIDALDRIYQKMAKVSIQDYKSVVKHMGEAAERLDIKNLPLKEIRRKHIKMCLTDIQTTKGADKWGAPSWNRYRTYLMSMFKELMELEAIESDPAFNVSKQIEVPKKRQVLNDKERKQVDLHLKMNYYTFWRYAQIFFHSGCRTTELLKVKVKDVNLNNQTAKITVIKGKHVKVSDRTIKDIALPLWIELIDGASPDAYVFGENLAPQERSKPILESQITRRWEQHVKEKLEIKADFYSLKHLNTTDVVDLLGDEVAASLNGHTSTAMVKKIYDVKQSERQHENIKGLGNAFSKRVETSSN